MRRGRMFRRLDVVLLLLPLPGTDVASGVGPLHSGTTIPFVCEPAVRLVSVLAVLLKWKSSKILGTVGGRAERVCMRVCVYMKKGMDLLMCVCVYVDQALERNIKGFVTNKWWERRRSAMCQVALLAIILILSR